MIFLALLVTLSFAFPLTLKEAVDIAIRHHIESIKSEEDLKKVEAQIREIRANLFPLITFSASYTRWDKSYISAFVPADRYMATFSLQQTIFDRSVFESLKLAKESRRLQRAVIRDVRRRLATEVEKIYWLVLLSREVLKEKERSLAYWEEFFKLVEEKYKSGVVPKYELLRAKAQLSRARADLLKAKGDYRTALRNLKTFLGLSKDFEVEGELKVADIPLKDLYSALEKNNTTLRMLRASLAVRRRSVSLQRSAYYPRLGAFFNYNWDNIKDFERGRIVDRFRHGYNFGVRLDITLFDGFRTPSKVLQEKIELTKVSREIEFKKRELTNQLENLLDQLKTAEGEIQAQKDLVIASEESLKYAHERYRYGVGTQVELLDARREYERARIAFLQAVYNYNTIVAEIKRLVLP